MQQETTKKTFLLSWTLNKELVESSEDKYNDIIKIQKE